MTEDRSIHSAETLTVSALNRSWHPKLPLGWMRHSVVLLAATLTGLFTAQNITLVQALDRKIQTAFFQVRGPINPPADIIILALDQNSLDQGSKIYPSDPQKYSYLAPLETSPPRRTAYATAITRLLQAGARVVALDVLFDAPSDRPEDDQQFQTALAQQPKKVVLIAQYEGNQTDQGHLMQLTLPDPRFRSLPLAIGYTNYPLDPQTSTIHLLSSQYPLLEAATYPPDQAQEFLRLSASLPSFAQAILQADGYPFKTPKGSNIQFYGPEGTFNQIPFWEVLDPNSWAVHQDKGTFKNRVVLIGATAKSFKDILRTPFGDMPGVEVHANSVATLMQNRSIAEALTHVPLRGLVMGLGVLAIVYWQSRLRHPWQQIAGTGAGAVLWAGIGYILFTSGQLIVPVAVPMVAIASSGVAYLIMGSLQRRSASLDHKNLIPSEQETELDQEGHRKQVEGQPINLERGALLASRYEIVNAIGAGGFGKTYKARDTQRPGHPFCVVKQLRPARNDPKHLKYAQDSFKREAQVLEALGKEHPQIPGLLAYFAENGEFYLVQEFIEGIALQRELGRSGQTPECQVLSMLKDLLPVLAFIHRHRVIHRDIKPSNIIRRSSDKKLVLIDFGAVKTAMDDPNKPDLTVGIGTPGYTPPEQMSGQPRYNSDLYALGIVAVEALTGLPPNKLQSDLETGEILWQQHAPHVSKALADIVSQMIQGNADKRYQSSAQVLEALSQPPFDDLNIAPAILASLMAEEPTVLEDDAEDDTATRPWPTIFSQGAAETPSTQSATSQNDPLSSPPSLPPTDTPDASLPLSEEPTERVSSSPSLLPTDTLPSPETPDISPQPPEGSDPTEPFNASD